MVIFLFINQDKVIIDVLKTMKHFYSNAFSIKMNTIQIIMFLINPEILNSA